MLSTRLHRVCNRAVLYFTILVMGFVFGCLAEAEAQNPTGRQILYFTASGAGGAVSTASSAITYNQLSWMVSGIVSACSIQLDSSADGVTWNSGDLITAQACTTAGASAIVNHAAANYTRMNMVSFTGTGTVRAIWQGWATNPAGGGGTPSGNAGGDLGSTYPNPTVLKTNGVAFGTAATVNTGTSGATIPLNSTANTASAPQAISQTNQTNQTIPGQTVTNSAAITDDLSTNTGADYTLSTIYTMTKFTCPANNMMGSMDIRLKSSGTFTNPSAKIFAQIFADSSGTPTGSTIVNTGGTSASIVGLIAQLSTSYARYRLGFNPVACTAGQTYWLGVQVSALPTGANVVIDSTSGSNLGATSANGTAWTLTNNALNVILYGRDYEAVRANSDTNVGVDGRSVDQSGVSGFSTNNSAVNGISTNSYGVFGEGLGGGGDFVSAYGFGVQALSQSGNAASFGIVNGNCPPAVSSCPVIASVASSAISLSRTLNANAQNVTGTMLAITDNPTNTGTWQARSIDVTIGATRRFSAFPMTPNTNANPAYLFDTQNTLSAAGSKIASFQNNTSEVMGVLFNGVNIAGSLSSTTLATSTNCSSGASPAVCGSASAGSIAVPIGTNPTLQVNTTAVTANSQIFLQSDDTLGTKLSVTCNSTLASLAVEPVVTARTAATSFTVTVSGVISTNPVCLSYFIVN
jgi:hypothetical protein